MSFSQIIKKKYKALLPFSALYYLGIQFHHFLFNSGIKKQYQPHIPTICIGNLSVGGTGKTPMVEKLIQLLENKISVAVVSRGYHRKTKGLVIANENITADDIGDEPYQYFSKYKNIRLAVAEKRVAAIQYFEKTKNADVIILDDAMQHLAVQPGFTIMLTQYSNPFYSDYYLPAGELRDLKKNYSKANLIVVTKCPETLTIAESAAIADNISSKLYQQVFFSTLNYDNIQPVFKNHNIENIKNIILVTGIANAQPVLNYLSTKYSIEHHFNFSDHHDFSALDTQNIKSKLNSNNIIITTEKDATKLQKFKNELENLPIFVLPVSHKILFDKEKSFISEIMKYIEDCNL